MTNLDTENFTRNAPAWGAFKNMQHLFQYLTIGLLLGCAVALSATCALALFGVLPWLDLQVMTSTGEALNIGVWVQSLSAALVVGLCFFIPSARHVKTLERSHRDFSLTMTDVTQAYQLAHAADRAGTFSLSTEFENIRDRLTHMRSHPDLGQLEPEVLELAAQMSFTTRELAQVYSEDKVTRAKSFLKERQHELDTFSENLALAMTVTQELKRWQGDIEASELEAQRQMDRLEKDLKEILPALGYEMDETQFAADASDTMEPDLGDDSKVVSLQSGAPNQMAANTD